MEKWREYQLTYIERDLGLTGIEAEQLLPERDRACRYVQQFTKVRQAAKLPCIAWEDFR